MESGPEARIRAWFERAVRAVDPAAAVQRHLQVDGERVRVGEAELTVRGKIWVAAVGKAATGMTRGALAAGGARIAGGVVITKDGHVNGELPGRFQVFEAAHPIPDERGVAATQAMLAMVLAAGEGDLVLALISGGGSALLEAPRPPVTLADMARTTDLLLRAGAPIDDLNAVRIPLSLVKGGGLRRAGGQTPFATMLLSDVLGNDPSVIASGPTVPSSGGTRSAWHILERYGLMGSVPPSVVQALRLEDIAVESSNRPIEPVVVVGDNAAALTAARMAATDDGYRVDLTWKGATGEASELGRRWVQDCQAAGAGVDVLLGGGEATVTVRGEGVGGRNTEFALAAAIALSEAGVEDWTVASLATDGQDGPTGVAGAVADAGTVARAAAAGIDPHRALRENDSLRVFEAAGGVVRPGPTGTNVNDIYVAVRTTSRAIGPG